MKRDEIKKEKNEKESNKKTTRVMWLKWSGKFNYVKSVKEEALKRIKRVCN